MSGQIRIGPLIYVTCVYLRLAHSHTLVIHAPLCTVCAVATCIRWTTRSDCPILGDVYNSVSSQLLYLTDGRRYKYTYCECSNGGRIPLLTLTPGEFDRFWIGISAAAVDHHTVYTGENGCLLWLYTQVNLYIHVYRLRTGTYRYMLRPHCTNLVVFNIGGL